MKLINKKENSGFTLVELMVATSLFIVIMLSALGALFMLIDESKNSRALRVSMENVNFAMDSMTRSIRMGTYYYCGIAPLPTDTLGCNNGSVISFLPRVSEEPNENDRVRYEFDNINKTIKMYDKDHIEGVPIISPEVKIDLLRFNVSVPNSTNPEIQIQPSVYIVIRGTVMVKGVPTSFALQTLASQRNF
jgi:hypothetical protein